MEAKRNAPTWSAPGPGNGGDNLQLLSTPDYSPLPNTSQAEELAQYETQMAEADATGDLDAWLSAYMRWLDLHYQMYVEGVQ